MATSEEERRAKEYAEMRQMSVLETLSDFYKPYYEELCFLLAGTYWVPYCGTRSLKDQETLYEKGRTPESKARGEKIVTNSVPGNSPHNYGCASDWAEFRPDFRGQDIWEKADWPVFAEAVRKASLVWGGNFKSIIDKPHCELPIKISWKEIGNIYRAEGHEMAILAIEKNMFKGEKKI